MRPDARVASRSRFAFLMVRAETPVQFDTGADGPKLLGTVVQIVD